MSFGGYVRRTVFWTKDRIFYKSNIRRQYTDIKEILENYNYGVSKVDIYIDNLLNHATGTTEFYSEYKGKPFSKFPIMNKSIYNEQYDAFISNWSKDKKLHTMSTSGSTGTPFTVLQNSSKRNRVLAELKLFGEYCGYKSHEKMVFLRVLSEKTRKSKITDWFENIYRIDISALNKNRLRKINSFIINKNIEAIISYGSTFDHLVSYIKNGGYNPDDYKVKIIIAGGEAIDIRTRKKLKVTFGDKCNVVSRYSNQEMGILGQDSNISSGFELNHGSYFFECLKIGCDEPAKEGEVGRIVITDLFNYAFPLIRYDTGDTGIMECNDNRWPKIKEIYGKQRDLIYNTKGEPVSPAIMSVYMWGLKGIKQWQFIQEKKDEYCLKLNGAPDCNIETAMEELKRVLGDNARINISYVNEIPVLSSNKRRYTVCNLKQI